MNVLHLLCGCAAAVLSAEFHIYKDLAADLRNPGAVAAGDLEELQDMIKGHLDMKQKPARKLLPYLVVRKYN